MHPEFKHFPVNWMDGMKISSKEFIAFDSYIQDTIRDLRCHFMHEYSYGMLPSSNFEVNRYPKLQFNSAQSSIVLMECRAVTPGGFRIEISEKTYESTAFPAQMPSVRITPDMYGVFEVFIVIKDFDRVGAGRYAEDLPPRHKLSAPSYELYLQRKGENTYGGVIPNTLKISEIELRDGKLSAIFSETGDYIPPCTTVSAHHRLKDAHSTCEQYLTAILEHTKTLLSVAAPSIDVNQDAKDAIAVAEKIGAYIWGSLSKFRKVIPNQSPIELITYFNDLATYFRFSVELCFKGNLIKKSYDQYGVSQRVENLINMPVNHSHIHPVLSAIIDFLQVFEQFMNALSQTQYRTVFHNVVDKNKEEEDYRRQREHGLTPSDMIPQPFYPSQPQGGGQPQYPPQQQHVPPPPPVPIEPAPVPPPSTPNGPRRAF
jgi:hypothetical protein